MTQETTKILEEFGDDVMKVCEEVIDLRNQLDDANDKIEDLQMEASNHECSTE